MTPRQAILQWIRAEFYFRLGPRCYSRGATDIYLQAQDSLILASQGPGRTPRLIRRMIARENAWRLPPDPYTDAKEEAFYKAERLLRLWVTGKAGLRSAGLSLGCKEPPAEKKPKRKKVEPSLGVKRSGLFD